MFFRNKKSDYERLSDDAKIIHNFFKTFDYDFEKEKGCDNYFKTIMLDFDGYSFNINYSPKIHCSDINKFFIILCRDNDTNIRMDIEDHVDVKLLRKMFDLIWKREKSIEIDESKNKMLKEKQQILKLMEELCNTK